MNYKPHKLAELFPVISASEMTALMKSIKAEGLHQPIVLFEGRILDGRHRYEACELAEVEPKFVEYEGSDAVAFVISANLSRRHLSTGERAAIAAKLATLRPGQPMKSNAEKKPANLPVKQSEAAETLGVSERSVRSAVKIKTEAPKLFDRVSAGEITLHAAEAQLEGAKPKGEVLDVFGFPVPEDLQELWARRDEAESMSREVAGLRNRLLKLQADKDALWGLVGYGDVIEKLGAIHQAIGNVRLYAVCGFCSGRGRKSCKACGFRGLMSKFQWTTVLSEVKAMRESLREKVRGK